MQVAGTLAGTAAMPWVLTSSTHQARRADVLIRGGWLHDGSGRPPVVGDVAMGGGRILATGELRGWSARRSIDASDKVVAPGFIDPHSHAAESLVRRGLHSAEAVLAQGVTTLVVNPDGGGPVDLDRQRAALQRLGVGVNVAPLIGHGSIRATVLGGEHRAPASPERDRMRDLVRRGMAAGAFGVSSGLFYTPGAYAGIDELVDLMRVAAERLGATAVHTSHIRDEGTYSVGVVAAVDEIIAIAERSSTTGIITHMKALGPEAWGKVRECAAHIDAARARGVAVWADQYPYAASGTSLYAALVPREAQVGGRTALATRLADPGQRATLRDGLRENIARRGGAASLVVSFHPPDRRVEGQSLEAIARARGMSPEETALALIGAHDTPVVSFNMSMDDIEFLMRRPWTMTCSDGAIYRPGEGRPHPRGHGAFTRKLVTFVRERRTIALEQALHGMTGLPAQVFSLHDRGVLREGAHADVVVFDLAALVDAASYREPHRHAAGMSHVFVNGVEAVAQGRPTGALGGALLRREVHPS